MSICNQLGKSDLQLNATKISTANGTRMWSSAQIRIWTTTLFWQDLLFLLDGKGKPVLWNCTARSWSDDLTGEISSFMRLQHVDQQRRSIQWWDILEGRKGSHPWLKSWKTVPPSQELYEKKKREKKRQKLPPPPHIQYSGPQPMLEAALPPFTAFSSETLSRGSYPPLQ